MKRIVYISICFICHWLIQPLAAQSFLNLDVAQNFSTFKFSYNPIISDNNSPYPSPEYSQISTTAYGVGYSYFHKSGAFALGGLGFRKAGASLIYKKTNYLWNLQYFDVKLGIGYQFNKWRIKPYASIIPYYAYLMNAKQSIGQNYYDIKADKALKAYDFGLLLNLGANIKLSQYIALYAEYGYNLGLKNIEPEEEQYLYNRGFLIKLGLAININNIKTIQEPVAKQTIPQTEPAEIETDNFQPSQFQLAGAKTNSSAASNISNGTTNPASTELSQNNSQNPTEQKIESPGTVGWTRTAPVSSPKPKNTLTGSASENSDAANVSENGNFYESKSAGNATESANRSVSTTSPNTAGNNATTAGSNSANPNAASNTAYTSNSSETKRNQPADSKTANTSAATYGAVPVPQDKNNSGSEMVIPAVNAEQKTKKLSSDDKVVFKVQLTAVKNALGSEHPILQNIKGEIRAEKGRDGWLRYYLGSYKTYDDAYKELKKIKAKGLAEGGFIVAFKNGKKITVAEAKELLK